MERYAIIIKTDGVCVLLHCYPGDCLSLEEMQKIVEGHIEAVPTALAQGWSQEPGVGLALIVNEEGKLQNLPVNQTATDLSAAYNDVIVGNAILPVSYTHLDVYKRQGDWKPRSAQRHHKEQNGSIYMGQSAGAWPFGFGRCGNRGGRLVPLSLSLIHIFLRPCRRFIPTLTTCGSRCWRILRSIRFL